MELRRRLSAAALRLAAAISICGGWAIVGAAPAGAECVYADAWLTRSGGGTTRVTPWPRSHCVVATPWSYVAEPYAEDSENWVPAGLPNGFGVRAGVTAPV